MKNMAKRLYENDLRPLSRSHLNCQPFTATTNAGDGHLIPEFSRSSLGDDVSPSTAEPSHLSSSNVPPGSRTYGVPKNGSTVTAGNDLSATGSKDAGVDLSASIGRPDENISSPKVDVQNSIVLLGKIGHGKTRLVNMMCGEDFESNMGRDSCTRVMQIGTSLRHGISVIDTPGFYSCRDTTEHIAQQKFALEGEPLNGIFAVVKFGRSDEMVDIVSQVMDFCGDDDIRILVTHADISAGEESFNASDTRDLLSEYLDVPICNIAFVGKRQIASAKHGILTTPEELEDFIHNALHDPRSFKVSTEQSAYMSARSPGARQFDGELQDVNGKIDAAEHMCESIASLRADNVNARYLNDVKTAAILAVQRSAKRVASDAAESINGQAFGLSASELNTVHVNVNVKLKLRLDRFVTKTSGLVPSTSHSYGLYTGRSALSLYGPRSTLAGLNAEFKMNTEGSQDASCWIVKVLDEHNREVSYQDMYKLALELQSSLPRRNRAKRKQSQLGDTKYGLIDQVGRKRSSNATFTSTRQKSSPPTASKERNQERGARKAASLSGCRTSQDKKVRTRNEPNAEIKQCNVRGTAPLVFTPLPGEDPVVTEKSSHVEKFSKRAPDDGSPPATWSKGGAKRRCSSNAQHPLWYWCCVCFSFAALGILLLRYYTGPIAETSSVEEIL